MEEVWTFSDVYLLTDGRGGDVAVPHLTLTFLDSGMALGKAGGEPVWNSDWAELSELSPIERSVLPDGRAGVVIAVVERNGRQRHRFVLATDDAVATETALRERAAAHGLHTRSRRPAVSRLLTVGIVLALLATMTVLLLSAVHVVRF